jgi:hypothetical protein
MGRASHYSRRGYRQGPCRAPSPLRNPQHAPDRPPVSSRHRGLPGWQWAGLSTSAARYVRLWIVENPRLTSERAKNETAPLSCKGGAVPLHMFTTSPTAAPDRVGGPDPVPPGIAASGSPTLRPTAGQRITPRPQIPTTRSGQAGPREIHVPRVSMARSIGKEVTFAHRADAHTPARSGQVHGHSGMPPSSPLSGPCQG